MVERAFRSYKTVDLKVRPIYHWTNNRVRAHVFLCLLAYYVEWHMRRRLAPLLFDDHDPNGAPRPSVVAPAKVSRAAQQKAQSKRTADGLPVHSFRTLLEDLATIVRNQVVPKLPGARPFTIVTRAHPVTTAGAGSTWSSPIDVPSSVTQKLDLSILLSTGYVITLLEVQINCNSSFIILPPVYGDSPPPYSSPL